jgi:hypothetical protein
MRSVLLSLSRLSFNQLQMVGQLHLFGAKRQTVMRHIVQEDFVERDPANRQEFHSNRIFRGVNA